MTTTARGCTAVGVAMAVFLALASGCGGADGPDTAAGLADIPAPELSRVEDVVRQALDRERQEFDAKLAAGQATADDHGHLAMLYHAHEQLVPADAAYRNAIVLEPRQVRWRYYLGRLLERVPDVPAARTTYADLLALDANHLPALVRAGELALDDADLGGAEKSFRRALDVDPDCVPALAGLGKVALARGEYQAAVDRLERALELSPESSAVNYPLGLAWRGLGDDEHARYYLEGRGNVMATVDNDLMAELEALEVGWRFHSDRGLQLAEEGRYAQALESFREAATLAPDEVPVLVNLGTTLARLERLDEAIAAFERALVLEPDNPDARLNLGTLTARAGNDTRAVEHYEAVLRVEPDNHAACFNLANALRRLGRYDAAAERFAQVVAADPGNGGARLAEALSLVAARSWEAALDRLEAAFVVLPEDRRIREALARLLATTPIDGLRNGARARLLAEALLAEERTLSHVETLAMAAAESGDFAVALQWQAAAIEAAERAGHADALPELRANLERYRVSTPCRRPWHPDAPALRPPALATEP